MYLPDHFREQDLDEVRSLVEAHPLCTLVASTRQGLTANHLPLLWLDDTRLIGHVALANTLHEELTEDEACLAVFQACDYYVSPNWYPSKAVHHRHVPTWNYQVVHLHGKISWDFERHKKAAIVARLTRHHENRVNGDRGWKMADAPNDFLESMLEGIVAMTFHVERIEAKSKLSQNRNEQDRQGVIDGLEGLGQATHAESLRRRKD